MKKVNKKIETMEIQQSAETHNVPNAIKLSQQTVDTIKLFQARIDELQKQIMAVSAESALVIKTIFQQADVDITQAKDLQLDTDNLTLLYHL